MADEWVKDDFATSAPYESVLSIKNPFDRQVQIDFLAKRAKDVGVTNFKTLLKEYRRSVEEGASMANVTRFPGQPLELEIGEWIADEYGISRLNPFTGVNEIVCGHPLLPVERLVNIDTGEEKLRIAFCRADKRWKTVVIDKEVAASAQKITCLSKSGAAVTSENAKMIVRFLSDVEEMNYTALPESKCVSRLGYIQDEGFSPFVDGLKFDGDANYRTIFEAVKSRGKLNDWIEMAREIRSGSISARIVLAASFASALVEPVGILPFFVHLWGGESGTGKTVALMVAASVWADPTMGHYIQTFNSTIVGREKFAAFLNHLPMIIDELQLSRGGRQQFDIYALSEGVGRTRGNKSGGIDVTPTWRNCILTSGESPITSVTDGAGAINRVVEIECNAKSKIIEDGHKISAAVKRSYGHAGRLFVERLYEDAETINEAHDIYSAFFKGLSERDTTEKQAMAAAVILTADELATRWIFQDGRAITPDELAAFLASKSAASVGRRGYEYMRDWVAQNSLKLNPAADRGDLYGVIDGDYAYIIRSVFNRAVQDAGFSPSALLSWLRAENMIQTRGRNMTRGKRINGVVTECVCLKLTGETEDLTPPEEDIPF